MQKDQNARLKLLSVLKVPEVKSEPVKQDNEPQKPRSVAVAQLKSVLFKGQTNPNPDSASPSKAATSSVPVKHRAPPVLKSPTTTTQPPVPSSVAPPPPPGLILNSSSVPKMPALIRKGDISTHEEKPSEPIQPNPQTRESAATPTIASDVSSVPKESTIPTEQSSTEKEPTDNATPAATPAGPTGNPPPTPYRRRLFYVRTPDANKGSVDILWRAKYNENELLIPDNYKLRPGAPITCAWKLPLSLFPPPNSTVTSSSPVTAADKEPVNESRQLMIGLYRFGCLLNKEGSIISKPLLAESFQLREEEDRRTGNRFRFGKVRFFCPKSAGVYLFRIYDANSIEGNYEALAVSVRYTIQLLDRDILSNLKFVVRALEESAMLKSIGLLNLMLPHMKVKENHHNQNTNNTNSSSNNSSGELTEVIQDLNYCVEKMLQHIDETMLVIEEGQARKAANALAAMTLKEGEATTGGGVGTVPEERRKLRAGTITEEDGVIGGGEEEEEADFWKKYRHAMKLHLEIYELCLTLMKWKLPWYWISERTKSQVRQRIRLFCPLLRRFFRSLQEMQEARRRSFDFCPPPPSSSMQLLEEKGEMVDRRLGKDLSEVLLTKIQSYMTNEQFESERLALCQRLEHALRSQGFLASLPLGGSLDHLGSSSASSNTATSIGFHLALYGSSRNGFGNPGSDIDICLAIDPPSLSPATTAISCQDPIVKLKIMCDLEEKLQVIGMKEVKALLTARVPIVEFLDDLTDLNCDISFQNDLAVANTEMLRLYGQIDERVRQLAYLVKEWAKARAINSPSQGTLGSYGYVLTVIHFLQNRPIPILPNLQSLFSLESPVKTAKGPIRGSSYHEEEASAEGASYTSNSNNTRSYSRDLEKQQQKKMMVSNPVDGTRCNVYYFQPTPPQLLQLQTQAKQNQESLSELFLEYLRYFSFQFDLRHQVVSIREQRPLLKLEKYEYYCWQHSDLLAIEDPFEIHYDVAHVLRPGKMAIIRKEYLRAYTILSRCLTDPSPALPVEDSLPQQISPQTAVELLFEPVVVVVPGSTLFTVAPPLLPPVQT